MILVNHPLSTIKFFPVSDLKEIQNTPSNSTIELADDSLIPFCKKNSIPFALHVKNIKELIFANVHGASYAIINKELATYAHKVATEYLFDLKVIVSIEDEEEIETLALLGIDGVIFTTLINQG